MCGEFFCCLTFTVWGSGFVSVCIVFFCLVLSMHFINLFNIKEKHIFYSENNHSLEQPAQGCGIVPITGGFQDLFGQAAR